VIIGIHWGKRNSGGFQSGGPIEEVVPGGGRKSANNLINTNMGWGGGKGKRMGGCR